MWFIFEFFLVVIHTVNNLSVEFKWKRNRLFDEDACLALYNNCTDSPEAKVIDTKVKQKSKWRPLPMDTIVS